MDRAPYPARIAAGLIVTALEETRKLPALLITLPMTAISQTLQAGMRAQQNIAELAIKGDAALEMLFDRPDEQPEWARFDEDDAAGPDPVTPAAPASTTDTSVQDKKPKAVATTPSPTTIDEEIEEAAADADLAAPPRADAGRFALYSSTPDEVVAAEVPGTEAVGSADGSGPEIVELIDYDTLTLAQLRARLRSVAVEDLIALVDYEKSHRDRAPFVTMLENRIAAQNKRSTEA
ncbi:MULTISPECIES: lipid droplet-associated protein [Gordonia]|uniref:lipid droplet-associated protein n=1 Tax=Gordonia TaxID=2053 RepID=UPI001CFA5CBE|nr:lipid droplet-associated protein [Gordonia sp. WA4-43]UCZ89912.1 lipid droplet-associated protein [Gordonia sp. WA4-43]